MHHALKVYTVLSIGSLSRCVSPIDSLSYHSIYFIVFVLQTNPNFIYADLAVTKRKNRPIPPALEDTVGVYSELMAEEQADLFRRQLEQKRTPYDDIQISSTSFQTSVTVIPPGIHGDRYVITFKEEETRVSINKVEERPQNVEETFENQNPVSHHIPTSEDNKNDISPPVPTRVLSQNSPRRTPPIPPPTTPPHPLPSHLSSSSQVSQSGNIPDIIIQYSQDEMEKVSTQEDIWKPEPGQLPGITSSKLQIPCLDLLA